MKKYYSWAQNNSHSNYLSSNIDAYNYILKRTSDISKIPQKHFDKFISDIIILCDNDILIDFNGKSNFFYEENEGFQFIDLDSHTDYKYGLNTQKYDSRKIAVIGGFTPCHLSSDTKIFSHLALDPKAISEICSSDLKQLSYHNELIFQKCRLALLNNGIAESKYIDTIEKIKIFSYP